MLVSSLLRNQSCHQVPPGCSDNADGTSGAPATILTRVLAAGATRVN